MQNSTTIRKKNSSLKLHSFDLADEDRAALARIRAHLQLNSNALAIRVAIRTLDRELAKRNSVQQ